MIEIRHIIKDNNGIHARPAGIIAKEAKRFSSDITVSLNGKSAEAARIFALMQLGAKHSDEIVFCISGEDEKDAASAFESLLEKTL